MKSKNPLSLILLFFHKNKRFFNLVQDFSLSLNPFSISGLTKYIEKIISIDFNLARLLNVTHIWIFSQRRLSMFVHFSPLFTKKTLTFEITNFILKNEFPGQKNLKSNNSLNIFLFLNNISDKSELGIFLNKNLAKLLPIKKNTEDILGKSSRCILFDFDPISEIMEYRCYLIGNNNLMIPRTMRKLKKIKKNCKTILPQKRESTNNSIINDKLKVNKIRKIVRVVEIGPRITIKIPT